MPASTVFTKLQSKDHSDIVVLNAPASFEGEVRALEGVRVHRDLKQKKIAFALAFVTRQAEVDRIARALAEKSEGDAALWFAYPKGSSKNLKSDISRDAGWQALGDLGFEPVRMIAIDDDWSALRFRRTEFIKTMKRDPAGAMSAAGKARTRRNA